MDALKLSVMIRGGRGDDEEDTIMAWLDSLPKDKTGEPYKETVNKHVMRALFQYVAHGLPKVPLIVEKPGGVIQNQNKESPVQSPSETVSNNKKEADDAQDYQDLRKRIAFSIRRVSEM